MFSTIKLIYFNNDKRHGPKKLLKPIKFFPITIEMVRI